MLELFFRLSEMRELSYQERNLIQGFASRLPGSEKDILLQDLSCAKIESTHSNEECLVFFLEGYNRTGSHGQHLYSVEAKASDCDGEEISILLYADEFGRLLELEFIRWADGPILGIDWDTVEFY
ncbi:DUF6984 family protein [Orrella dioscoreae]|uniref:DUF6984 family protein n=1 Tax=Orrella dioscoreae TaxID=1851544 RepID=UPI00130002E8|nr:hypothetical protein [Orrella dioscoreae]